MAVSIAKGTYKPGTLYIPFGPFLAIGALVGMLFGCQWFKGYMASFKTNGQAAGLHQPDQSATLGVPVDPTGSSRG